MRKLTFLLTFFMLLGSVQLQAKEYAIKDIPMVHLQNRTRYVSNPDSILSSTAVTTMDSILYALAYIIHSGFISGYQNRYGDNLKPPTNVYHRMTA